MSNKFVFLVLLISLFSIETVACSCIGRDSVKQAIRNSDVVIIGTVISKDTISIATAMKSHLLRLIKSRVVVDKLVKGRVRKDTITIITGMGSGDCGFGFVIGERYIIYAIWQKKYYPGQREIVSKYLFTDICTRTCKYSKYEEGQLNYYSSFFRWRK